MTSRRQFLNRLGIGLAGSVLCRPAAAADGSPLIADIEKLTLLRGRDGSGPTWFHPRACMVPEATGATAFMTLQTIGGSDYFGPVHWMSSRDWGRTWSDPRPVPPLGRVKQPDGVEEGVCDVVPEWHPRTGSVLALGHNVFYSGPKFSADQPPRWPVYAVWGNGRWGPRRKLEWDDPRGAYIYSNNCGQRIVLPNGDIHLTHSEGLFLVYTRRDASNPNVIRWRSPLWLAQVDPDTLRLRRDTERVVLSLVGDGVDDANRVALMGNFHITSASPHESSVTVGEWQPRNHIRGDLLLARIRWSRPHQMPCDASAYSPNHRQDEQDSQDSGRKGKGGVEVLAHPVDPVRDPYSECAAGSGRLPAW